jgi:hypothetical protein
MRILIRTSMWANWAQRLGSLALPLTIVPVLLHREQFVTSDQFAATEVVALAVAAAAIVAAVGGLARIWITGDRGWGRAIRGLLLGLVCLAPIGYCAWLAARYPLVSEVSTDFTTPLPLVAARPTPTDPVHRALVAEAFPNARNRDYPVDATQVFAVVTDLVGERGWEVLITRAPQSGLEVGNVNAVATSLLGWRSEVAIAVTGTPQGATVAMESASLYAFHDFGDNGQRIEEFLAALDTRIAQLLRDAPTAEGTLDLGDGG